MLHDGTSRFAYAWSKIKQIRVIFNHLELWVAVAKHNFKVGENLNLINSRFKS